MIQMMFERLALDNPHPTTELIFNSTFELLIAVILSAQATDAQVNIATAQLFSVANTPEMIIALGEQIIKDYIKSIGLFNNKAKYIMQTANILIEKYHSQVPKTRQALESLPGVGRKTANVILNTAYGKSTIAVDTHVFRVANRTGLAVGKTPLIVENKLSRIIPTMFRRHAHHWLVLHGRYVCTARKPACMSCILQDLCAKSF